MNDDGFSDVMIGANRFDNPQVDQGSAFIYYGSAAGLSATPNWSAGSIGAYFSYLGISVSSAGDVNGDGFSDVITGAYAYDNVQTDEGKVFVYYGSASGLSSTANWTVESNQVNAHFGNSVSTAGDVNGDGYSDVIIGSSQYDNGHLDEGRAFVYFGSAAGLSATPNWTAESNQVSAYFGTSVATAGDVNGDGYSDVIVGSNLFDNGQANEGRAFVYHGSASILPKTLTLTMYMQGFYNANTNLMVRDTARVCLRNASPPYAKVDSAKAYLSTAGTGTLSFANASNGVNYYIQVRHRNSIETWSATGKSFTNNALTYNFTTALTQAYGNNMKKVDLSPVRFGIYGGDVNQDGGIDLTDGSWVDNASYHFVTGYVPSDLNGDRVVDLSDGAIVENNIYNFVGVIRP